nr:MAG TPA: hypothetical protein [Bacteriophage sp.]
MIFLEKNHYFLLFYLLCSASTKKAAKPFCNDLAAFFWSQLTDSNPRPADYKSSRKIFICFLS